MCSVAFAQEDCEDYISYYRVRGKKNLSKVLEKGTYCNGGKRQGDWFEYRHDQKLRSIKRYNKGVLEGPTLRYVWTAKLDSSELAVYGPGLVRKLQLQPDWRYLSVYEEYKRGKLHGYKLTFINGHISKFELYDRGVQKEFIEYIPYYGNTQRDISKLPEKLQRQIKGIPHYHRLKSYKSPLDTLWIAFSGNHLNFWSYRVGEFQYGVSYRSARYTMRHNISRLPDSLQTLVKSFPFWQNIYMLTTKDTNGTMLHRIVSSRSYTIEVSTFDGEDNEVQRLYDANQRETNVRYKKANKFHGRNIYYAYQDKRKYVSAYEYYTNGVKDSSVHFNSTGQVIQKSYQNPTALYKFEDGKLISYVKYADSKEGGGVMEELSSKGILIEHAERKRRKRDGDYRRTWKEHGLRRTYQVGEGSRELISIEKFRAGELVWTKLKDSLSTGKKEWTPGFGPQPGITIGYRGCGVCLGNPHRCNGIRLSLIDNKTYTKRINGINLVLFRGGKGSVSNTLVNGVSAEILGTQGTVSGNGIMLSALRAGRLGFALPGISLTSNLARKRISFSTLNTLSGLAEFRISSWRWPRYHVSIAPIHFKSSGWNRDFKAALSTGKWKNRNRGRIESGLVIGVLNIEPGTTPAEKIEKKKLKLMEKKYKWVTPKTFD